jgi:type II restriction enzyme
MKLSFEEEAAAPYTSAPQKVRVWSERWVKSQVYCPNCGHAEIERYGNNRPVADFFCRSCDEEYELKSQKGQIGTKVLNGAYRTMIERLQGSRNPNFFVLNYDLQKLAVVNLLIIPKHFFTPQIIERRKPLKPTARRAGWVGCNILLQSIPQAGRIFLVRNSVAAPKAEVLDQWQKTLFLREQKDHAAKGWLLSVMRCVEKLDRPAFSLNDVYQFEDELRGTYPGNRHIKEKIRQQLQVLRDKGFLEFTGRGTYRLTAGSR